MATCLLDINVQPNDPGEKISNQPTLTAALDRALTERGGAIVIETGERRISGTDLRDATARYAGVLASLGVAKGDRVAVQAEKSPELVFLYLACLRVGAAYLPINTAYQRSEVEYILGDAEPRLFVCTPQTAEQNAPLAKVAGAALLTIGETGDGTLPSLAADASPAPQAALEPDDMAALLYTSGTTGRPKGAVITQSNLVSNALALKDIWSVTENDVLLHALPIFHVHGLFVALNTALLAGCRMLWLPRFDVATVLAMLPRATVFMGVPTYYTRLLDDPGFGQSVVSGMRVFVSGSAPLLAETFARFAERTGHSIVERYGMTETQIIASNPLNGERVAGTVGYALPEVQIRVVDENGKVLSADEVGVVEVKGPNVLAGYWQMPEKTKSEFRDDGFFITGDVGVMDETGRLTLVGRAKDLIICGGLNVYPKEIEEMIDAMEGVRETAIIGLPHPDFGEAVAAIVDCVQGCTLTEGEIIAKLKGNIANFKVPKAVFFTESLPRNVMGKVQKNLLRTQYATTFTAAR